MTRDQAKDEIKRRIPCTDYLTKAPDGNYICPSCNSGSKRGQESTGAAHYYHDTKKWYCHACGAGGDVIDLYCKTHNTDYNAALQALAAAAGITIDSEPPKKPLAAPTRDESPETYNYIPTGENARQSTPEDAAADYTQYYNECARRIHDERVQEYLTARRISMDTARAYNIGFDPAADPAQSGYKAPRLIIPTGKEHYIARSIDPEAPKSYRVMNPKGAKPAIFNAAALYNDEVQEVFITEGIFDALSVIELGYHAIALNSTVNAKKLIAAIKEKPTKATLILSLDNDEPGQKAQRLLIDELKRLNISCQASNISGACKDTNEALQTDAAGLAQRLKDTITQLKRPDNMKYYIKAQMRADMESFNDSRTEICFSELNRKTGGIYSGLYVLAAASSLGKTTFALQIADGLAASGHDVIFFSLEQSRLELISKSLARIAAQQRKQETATGLESSPCAIAIRSDHLTAAQREEVKAAKQTYMQEISERMSVIEANMNCSAAYIGEYVKAYIERTRKRPIIFVDYLQILQPDNTQRRMTDKEATDANVTALKRLARDYNITVVVISSLNRANYLTAISFESLKESGSIEYTADVVIGLQLECMNEEIFDKKDHINQKRERVNYERRQTPRLLEAVCLKNRYGISNFKVKFEYFPACDLYIESPEADEIARPFKTDFTNIRELPAGFFDNAEKI